MNITEGMEWTDGWYAYIAYAKADGTIVVRDAECFDYSIEQWEAVLFDDLDDRSLVPVEDLTPAERIERWETEGHHLPR